MAFQIKDFVSIVASMINHARATTTKTTDWIPGSVARTIIESPAVEIEELYLQMFNGLRESIPVAIYKSFGFEKLPQSYATGFVYVSSAGAPSSPLTIPVGTVFTSSDGRTYLSSIEVVWSAPALSVRIPVTAQSAGVSYNIAAASITASPFFNSSYAITNSLIDNGRDVESDNEREARFKEFVESISQGSVAACLYAVNQTALYDADGNISESVARIGILERPGYVRIFICSTLGLPSSNLLSAANLKINGTVGVDGVRAAGIRVIVLGMVERNVDFVVRVEMLTGFALSPAVTASIALELDSLLFKTPSGTTLYLEDVVTGILTINGIKRVVIDGDANIINAPNETLKLGTLSVSPL